MVHEYSCVLPHFLSKGCVHSSSLRNTDLEEVGWGGSSSQSVFSLLSQPPALVHLSELTGHALIPLTKLGFIVHLDNFLIHLICTSD